MADFWRQAEDLILKEGPKLAFWVGVIFALTPVLVLAALFGGLEQGAEGFWLSLLVMSVPAALAFALWYALKNRAALAVPLTWALCAVSLYAHIDGADSALAGISPDWLLRPAFWLAAAFEVAACTVLVIGITRLWRHGRLEGTG